MNDITDYAVPLRWQDGEPSVDALMTLIGDADVVGLGEPTHGDSQSVRLKHAIVNRLSGLGGRTLLAWERGVGGLELLSKRLSERRGLPAEHVALMYPWVYREVLDLLDWLGAVGAERDVLLRGIDMDGPPPDDVIAELRSNARPPLSQALLTVQERVAESENHDLTAAEWSAMTQGLRSTAHGGASLSRADLLVLSAIAQWGEYERLKAVNATNPTPWDYRDQCLADNLVTQRDITAPDRVAFWAHNGHVSTLPARAGRRLADQENITYRAIGVAFGAGSFIAWEPRAGAYSRRLVPVTAQAPPAGSLEALLQHAKLEDCVIDLRAMRHARSPLAEPLIMREVGLAAAGSQFVAPRLITASFDILVWIEELSPASVIRGPQATW